jgi:imidazolonepropionase-like amidohydrolase
MDALAMITRNPAKALGLENRIGMIKAGFDADLVVWDRYPLEIGAQTTQVWIEGIQLVNTPRNIVPHLKVEQAEIKEVVGLNAQMKGVVQEVDCYGVFGATVYTMDNSENGELIDILVENGIITCLQKNCALPSNCVSIKHAGGIIVPGFVQVGSNLGLAEIEAETASQDGQMLASDIDLRNIHAIEGVRFNNYKQRHMTAAFAGGVTTHIAHLMSPALIRGQSGAYRTIGKVISDSIINDVVALDITIGLEAKGGAAKSISSQISLLRRAFTAASTLLESNKSTDSDPLIMALKGEIPVVLHSHNADEIAHFIRSVQEPFQLKMIVFGGAETHIIGQKLASKSISVILSPPRPFEQTFSKWKTLENAAATLENQGVTVAIASDLMDQIRNLRWLAGNQQARGFKRGLASITSIPSRLFGLDSEGVGVIRIGTKAAFSSFSADPLTYYGKIELVVSENQVLWGPTQY